jgi:hypothetical protein
LTTAFFTRLKKHNKKKKHIKQCYLLKWNAVDKPVVEKHVIKHVSVSQNFHSPSCNTKTFFPDLVHGRIGDPESSRIFHFTSRKKAGENLNNLQMTENGQIGGTMMCCYFFFNVSLKSVDDFNENLVLGEQIKSTDTPRIDLKVSVELFFNHKLETEI